jgi:hypothetical protein
MAKFRRVTRSKTLKDMILPAQSAIKERVAHALLLVLCKSLRLASSFCMGNRCQSCRCSSCSHAIT